MTMFGDKIFTPRLTLRKITTDDLPLLVSWSNSDSAHGQFLTPDKLSMESGQEKIASGVFWNDKNKTFFIQRRDTTPMGTITYWLRSEKCECAVIKVKITAPELRGQGYGTEVQKYLIIHLFDRLRLDEVEMYTDINNKAQQRCLGKLGFELIESLAYDDHQVRRLGHLYRLPKQRYETFPLYRYHYE
jgi:RimJ/RimL family protein N-acetyltransferase